MFKPAEAECLKFFDDVYHCVIGERMVTVMFFGKRDKDVRLTDKQYKDLVGNMSKRERKEFDRKQKQLQREKDDDWLLGMLFLTDDSDDI